MLNFLKQFYQLTFQVIFPPFCLGCEEALIHEKVLCRYCAESFFAIWDLEIKVIVLAPRYSQIEKIIRDMKSSRHRRQLIYALFLKALLELDLCDVTYVIQDPLFEDLKNLSCIYTMKKFNYDVIYTDKHVVFLGDSLKSFFFYKTYFENSKVKSLIAIFLHE